MAKISFVFDDEISALVDQLAEKITAENITFREAGMEIGVSAMAVCDWVRGRKKPTGLSIPAIANYLGVPIPGRPVIKKVKKAMDDE